MIPRLGSRGRRETIPAVTPPASFITDAARLALVSEPPRRGQTVRAWLETWRPKAAAKGAGA